jgi:geranylgeranyl pyrophosphate synthase
LDLSEIYAPVQGDLDKIEGYLKAVSKVEFPHLANLLDYSLTSVGKRIRPILTLLCGKFYDYNLERLLPMATAVEILHTATLVHDDSVDKSSVRRGRATINSLWGEEQAILLGDYLFAAAGSLTASTGNLRTIKLFAETLKIISWGEISQALNAYNLKLKREEYFDRMAKKTAALFVLSTESGAVLSGAPEPSIQLLNEYGYNLGMAFQVVDDILDFVGTEKQLGKPAGADLMQGTFTLPAMLVRERYPEEPAIKNLFKNKDDQTDTKKVIDLVRHAPEITEECYRIANDFCSKACRSLSQLPDKAARRSLLELADYVVRRKK